MIHLIWPTIRPEIMVGTHRHWVAQASQPQDIRTYVAVNTDQQKAALPDFDVKVVGTERRGATRAAYQLTQGLMGEDSDWVILASDDMYPPKHWDTWLNSQKSDSPKAIFINDGYVIQDCMTLPIMNYSCLLRLNRIIYHPSYLHQYSDTELLYNLKELDLLVDKRFDGPIFEHRHWACHKRKADEHDLYYAQVVAHDAANWSARHNLPIATRLTV